MMFGTASKFLASPIGKVSTYVGLFMGGNVGAQKIEQYRDHKRWDLPLCKEDLKFTAGWSAVIGGPMVYKWYTYIDSPTGFKKSWLGSKMAKLGPIAGTVKLPAGLIVGKVIVDLLFDIPLYGSYLYTKNLYANQDKAPLTHPQSYIAPFNQQFLNQSVEVYKKDLYFWTPANVIGFMFVADKYRIPYVSMATAAWACALPIVCKDKH